jgi:hypothetical protein
MSRPIGPYECIHEGTVPLGLDSNEWNEQIEKISQYLFIQTHACSIFALSSFSFEH